jgi:acetyltransferase-like isoleucine patch superfamily enzyme
MSAKQKKNISDKFDSFKSKLILKKISLIHQRKIIKSKIWKIRLNLKGVRGCNKVKVHKKPIIVMKDEGQIALGKNVTLHSNNNYYHAIMSSPVKLFALEGGKIEIGDNTRINGACLHAKKLIKIGNNCLIAANTSILDSNGHNLEPSIRNKPDVPDPIIIANNVWIGLNSIILKGSKIGDNSVISAGSIVKGLIPKNSLYKNNKIYKLRDRA